MIKKQKSVSQWKKLPMPKKGTPEYKIWKHEYDQYRRSIPGMKDKLNAQNNNSRNVRKIETPIRHKASRTINGLLWGKGGTDKMEAIIKQYLGLPCKYCKITLSLENMSLDHKFPYMSLKRRRKLTKQGIVLKNDDEDYGKDNYLNSEANLHFVCKTCNRMKSNLNDDQFTKLLMFLDQDQGMKKIVCAKLKMSNFIWKK